MNTRRTYRAELARALASGVIETAGTTFLLLAAVRVFHAGPLTKGLIAGGGSLGLLAGPLIVSRVARAGWTPSRAGAWLCLAGGLAFLAAALLPTVALLALAAVVGLAAFNALVPLTTQIYSDNYPDRSRGSLFGRTVVVRVFSATLFSWAAGAALTGRLEPGYPWLMGGFALAFGASAACLAACPSAPLVSGGGAWSALRWVREDRLFRVTLLSWMFLGFANLMMLPLRVEYLASPRYGLALSAWTVALLVGVVPNAVRLVMAPVWGALFDRMNFLVLRVLLNLGFLAGILSFFLSDAMPGLVAGSVLIGIAKAGGDVAWTLWVTKIAPAPRVADYMAVHAFLTGARSLAAPFLAFALATRVSLAAIGWGSAGLILVACVLLVPEVRSVRAREAALLPPEE